MQDSDYQWFLENYSELYDEFGASFLAIKNKNILGVYSTYADGVRETLRSEEIGTFIVQECNGNSSAYISYFI